MSIVKEIADLINERNMVLLNRGMSHAGLLYVENGVRAIIKAAESDKTLGEAYNLRDDCDRTWKDFTESLEKELGVEKSWSNIPGRLAFFIGFLMEKAYGLLRIRRRPLITRHMVYMFTRDQAYSTDKIKQDLGYSPEISYEEGIQRTAEWYRETYMQ
jgi:nucleoside-diphosphate-sugar epimerase